jgi:hypothetical protein
MPHMTTIPVRAIAPVTLKGSYGTRDINPGDIVNIMCVNEEYCVLTISDNSVYDFKIPVDDLPKYVECNLDVLKPYMKNDNQKNIYRNIIQKYDDYHEYTQYPVSKGEFYGKPDYYQAFFEAFYEMLSSAMSSFDPSLKNINKLEGIAGTAESIIEASFDWWIEMNNNNYQWNMIINNIIDNECDYLFTLLAEEYMKTDSYIRNAKSLSNIEKPEGAKLRDYICKAYNIPSPYATANANELWAVCIEKFFDKEKSDDGKIIKYTINPNLKKVVLNVINHTTGLTGTRQQPSSRTTGYFEQTNKKNI